MSWQNWQTPSEQPRQRFQYASPALVGHPKQSPDHPLPPRNEVELSPEMLMTVLTHLSTLIPSQFNGRPVRLVVHGGACMLLHPGLWRLSQDQHLTSLDGATLPRRTTTRDVDYINRSFQAEWHQIGVYDATERLQICIQATARQFGLGADWMNSDADVALPMAQGPDGTPYDPIYSDSIRPNNIDLHTVFTSPNAQLTLISVAPFWAVALKLTRYTRWDPGDICLLLRNGTALSGTQWTPAILEGWLFAQCWAMGYAGYDAKKIEEMRARIVHAVRMVSEVQSSDNIGMGVTPNPGVGVGASMGEAGFRQDMPRASWDIPAINVTGPGGWMDQAVMDGSADMSAVARPRRDEGSWMRPRSLGSSPIPSPHLADVRRTEGWVDPAYFGGHVHNGSPSPPFSPDSTTEPPVVPLTGPGLFSVRHGVNAAPGPELHRRHRSAEEFNRSVSSMLRSGLQSNAMAGDLPSRHHHHPKKHSHEDENYDRAFQPSPILEDPEPWHSSAHSSLPLTFSNLQRFQDALSSSEPHYPPRAPPVSHNQFSMMPPHLQHHQHLSSLGLY